jgi:dipeptidyl aminopeptidase
MAPSTSDHAARARQSIDSESSVSTTSIVFDRLSQHASASEQGSRFDHGSRSEKLDDDDHDAETGPFLPSDGHPPPRKAMDRGLRRILCGVAAVIVGVWLVGLVVFLSSGAYHHESDTDHDPDAGVRGSGKHITLDQIHSGFWRANSQSISWIAGPKGEDGLLLEWDTRGKDYVVVEDVRADRGDAAGVDVASTRVLMKERYFTHKDQPMEPQFVEPSPDLAKVLLAVNKKKNWRHSFTATYFVFDVATQTAEPLIPGAADAKVQLAAWSPQSDAIAFVRDNNMYIRRLSGSNDVVQVTKDGGPEYFYGIPDWVYEEEVFSGRSATWWSDDGKYLTFLRTNETGVPEFPVPYYLSRPSGLEPPEGEETYPEVRQIKYPRPGAHNPLVDLQYYDVSQDQVFSVPLEDEFAADDRIINYVLWTGSKVIVKETNRVSDVLRVVMIDVKARAGRTLNTINVRDIDGGWFEISHKMTYVPADPANGRPDDGYVDTFIHEGYEHLAYFTPLDNPEPVMLTSGKWEVDDAPAAVDLASNLVYFTGTKESSIQRHVYSVKLDGSGMAPLTNTSAEAYYTASFSSGGGFALLSYQGPRVPYQKVISTPSNGAAFEHVLEDNSELADRAKKHELPLLKYGMLDLGEVKVNYVERRPPHFDSAKKYPVLFYHYSGPGSQTVTKRFAVDFQAYVASALGYLVVTIDPRGTGFLGRRHRVVVRNQMGVLEAQDHAAAARHYAGLKYVDASRLAIWGWSYGGFATLKALEYDAGRTFSYGMAVAPVTDWRFYDSIYTERYMRTPQENEDGYPASKVSNATALGQNKRFLIMHGVSDDNVHLQNTLTLLDDLDLAGVENYDVHVFPDSDHSIYFHNGNRIVYDKLNNWLINAFNGEWLKIANPKPNTHQVKRDVASLQREMAGL